MHRMPRESASKSMTPRNGQLGARCRGRAAQKRHRRWRQRRQARGETRFSICSRPASPGKKERNALRDVLKEYKRIRCCCRCCSRRGVPLLGVATSAARYCVSERGSILKYVYTSASILGLLRLLETVLSNSPPRSIALLIRSTARALESRSRPQIRVEPFKRTRNSNPFS